MYNNKIRALTALVLLACGAALASSDWPSLPTLSGERLHLSDYAKADQAVLLSFWSVSCAPCFREMPTLKKLYQRLPEQGAVLISVTMPYDRPDHVVEATAAQQLPYPVALDIDAQISQAFSVRQTPVNLLLDKQGREVWRQVGEIDETALLQQLSILNR